MFESLNGEIILTPPPPPPSPSFSFSTHIDTVEKWVYPFIFVVFRCLPFLELARFLLAVVVRRDCRAAASERLLAPNLRKELDFICEILKVEFVTRLVVTNDGTTGLVPSFLQGRFKGIWFRGDVILAIMRINLPSSIPKSNHHFFLGGASQKCLCVRPPQSNVRGPPPSRSWG